MQALCSRDRDSELGFKGLRAKHCCGGVLFLGLRVLGAMFLQPGKPKESPRQLSFDRGQGMVPVKSVKDAKKNCRRPQLTIRQGSL